MIQQDPKEKAMKQVLAVLNQIDGLRFMAPKGAKVLSTTSEQLVTNRGIKQYEFHAILEKLTSEGVAEFEEHDTGFNWGANEMFIKVKSWKKFESYRAELTVEVNGENIPNNPPPTSAGGSLDRLHPAVRAKCVTLYDTKHYGEAVEKSFKVVRDRLRKLTSYERGSDAFGAGLYINGAAAENVDRDFQQAVKFLTMSIDNFRNEKSHVADGKIDDPDRAYEYLSMSSLAMRLLDSAAVPSKPKSKG